MHSGEDTVVYNHWTGLVGWTTKISTIPSILELACLRNYMIYLVP